MVGLNWVGHPADVGRDQFPQLVAAEGPAVLFDDAYVVGQPGVDMMVHAAREGEFHLELQAPAERPRGDRHGLGPEERVGEGET